MSTREMVFSHDGMNLEHIGWKYYNQIRKKAMEQEFSWAGLCISLSIAFFIVIATALVLKLAYISLTHAVEAASVNNSFDILEKSLYNVIV